VDDVHFLEGKGGSQEEFFHTFNALHIAQRQIVLSSDQPANDIPTLKAHLMSRFAAGLEAKIESPTYEMRLAILQQKAEARGRELAPDVLGYIATTVQTNIRELEGAVTKVIAYSALAPAKTPTVELAREALRDTVAPRTAAVSVRDIQEVVARYYGRTIADFQSRTWRKSTSLPRQICIYLCRKFTSLSLAEIGEAFAGKNHATIIYSLRKVDSLIQSDAIVRADVDRLIRELPVQP
jgi:chromosomal replication initiator protein